MAGKNYHVHLRGESGKNILDLLLDEDTADHAEALSLGIHFFESLGDEPASGYSG